MIPTSSGRPTADPATIWCSSFREAPPSSSRSPAGRPGCEKRTPRRLPAVTTMPPTPPMQPWQRHSEPGPVARAEAVVAPPGTNRPWMCAITTGHKFAESRFRASRVTFVRRQRPYRRSSRSRSSGGCSARAKRPPHRCRDKRCSVSSIPLAGVASALAPAQPGEAIVALPSALSATPVVCGEMLVGG